MEITIVEPEDASCYRIHWDERGYIELLRVPSGMMLAVTNYGEPPFVQGINENMAQLIMKILPDEKWVKR